MLETLSADQFTLLQQLGISPLRAVSSAAGALSIEPVAQLESVLAPEPVPSAELELSPASAATEAAVDFADAPAYRAPLSQAIPVAPSLLQQDVLQALHDAGITAAWYQQQGDSTQQGWQILPGGLYCDEPASLRNSQVKQALWQLICQHSRLQQTAE